MQHALLIKFGPYLMDFKASQLRNNGEVIKLRPKSLSVLEYLVRHPGRIITKDEIISSVWAGGHVTATALRVCITELRAALNDSAENPQFIETDGQIGYRFIAHIKDQTPDSTQLYENMFVVGRDTENKELDRLFELALNRNRQCVFITGEAGAGKTTLVQTFIERANAHYEIWLGTGQCVEQFSKGEAYRPILEALSRLCRGPFGSHMIGILSQHAPSWLIQMPALLDSAQLEELKSRTDDSNPERMLREMTEAIDAIAMVKPLVLIVEDLHWSDDPTLELISSLSRRKEPANLMILGTFRSLETINNVTTLRSISHELQFHDHCIIRTIKPLKNEAVLEYLSKRFCRADSLIKLAEIVHRKSGGNPLFMVNTVNMLISEGLIFESDTKTLLEHDEGKLEEFESMVPDTIQRTIEQQLNQYTRQQRAILRVASVVGQSFTVELVSVGLGLENFKLEEQFETLALHCPFVKMTGLAEWPDGTFTSQYKFNHSLYQNVAYGQLAAARRIHLHKKIGERLVKGFDGKTDEISAELAVHFVEAHDYSRAVYYLHQAAINSHKRNAPKEAIAYLSTAFNILKKTPDSSERDKQELTLLFSYGPLLMATHGNSAPEAKDVYERARSLCERQQQTPQIFQALKGLWQYYLTFGELSTAHDIGLNLLEIAEQENDTILKLGAYDVMANTLFPMGQVSQALSHARQGIALYDREKHQSLSLSYVEDPGVACRCVELTSLCILGFPEQALAKFETIFQLTERLDHTISTINALSYTSVCSHFTRNIKVLRDQSEKMIELSEEHSFVFWFATGQLLRGLAHARQGNIDKGIEDITKGLSGIKNTGAGIYRSYCLGIYAEACLFANKVLDGLEAIESALQHVSAKQEHSYESELYRLKGELLLKQAGNKDLSKTDLNTIEACFETARAISSEQGVMLFHLRASNCLGRLWQQNGQPREALKIVTESYSWFTEGFTQSDLKESEQLIDTLKSGIDEPSVDGA